MPVTYKVLSALLSYPERALQEAAPELIAALGCEELLSVLHRDALVRLISEIADADLLDAQAHYVDLFDRTRSLSLHLFEHVHGESRDRGQAMVSLLERYRAAGFDTAANELPDYLPLFLEFLSFQEAQEAREMLAETVPILQAIAERLEGRKSGYAAIFDALVALAGPRLEANTARGLPEMAIENPNDLTAIARAWEDAEVRFGPGDAQGNACPRAAEMLAKMEPRRSPADAGSLERLES